MIRIDRQTDSTLVEIATVVAILGLLSTIVLPNLEAARAKAETRNRPASRNQIGQIAVTDVLEYCERPVATFPYGEDPRPRLWLNPGGSIPGCPTGGIYGVDPIGVLPLGAFGNLVTPATPHRSECRFPAAMGIPYSGTGGECRDASSAE